VSVCTKHNRMKLDFFYHVWSNVQSWAVIRGTNLVFVSTHPCVGSQRQSALVTLSTSPIIQFPAHVGILYQSWKTPTKCLTCWYPLFNKNQAAWNFLSPVLEVTWRTVAIIIRVVLVSTYLCIRGISVSSIHYKQSRRVYINQRHQYIRLILS
jgi:hypothetical protein